MIATSCVWPGDLRLLMFLLRSASQVLPSSHFHSSHLPAIFYFQFQLCSPRLMLFPDSLGPFTPLFYPNSNIPSLAVACLVLQSPPFSLLILPPSIFSSLDSLFTTKVQLFMRQDPLLVFGALGRSQEAWFCKGSHCASSASSSFRKKGWGACFVHVRQACHQASLQALTAQQAPPLPATISQEAVMLPATSAQLPQE